jgi:hypothetical protein
MSSSPVPIYPLLGVLPRDEGSPMLHQTPEQSQAQPSAPSLSDLMAPPAAVPVQQITLSSVEGTQTLSAATSQEINAGVISNLRFRIFTWFFDPEGTKVKNAELERANQELQNLKAQAEDTAAQFRGLNERLQKDRDELAANYAEIFNRCKDQSAQIIVEQQQLKDLTTQRDSLAYQIGIASRETIVAKQALESVKASSEQFHEKVLDDTARPLREKIQALTTENEKLRRVHGLDLETVQKKETTIVELLTQTKGLVDSLEKFKKFDSQMTAELRKTQAQNEYVIDLFARMKATEHALKSDAG